MLAPFDFCDSYAIEFWFIYVHYSFKFPASYDSLYNFDGPYVRLSFVFIFNQAFIDLMNKGFPFLEKYLIANPTNFLFQ